MDNVRIERAGNIEGQISPGFKKVIIIRNYIKAGKFKSVKLFDDSMNNIKEFYKLKNEFSNINFEAFLAKEDGSIYIIK